ncbi:MAG: AAA family ATPase [Treponema sp.]|jgi:predicted ATPase|nr:AAA family ATPase [Treponema sp.]
MKLTRITVSGFKSIDNRHEETINFGDVCLVLGANGSGKSNLVSFFKMLGYMHTGALQNYVGTYGASQLLFYGPQITESINFSITLEDDQTEDTYTVKLSHGLPNRLFVNGERVSFYKKDRPKPQDYFLGSGGPETSLPSDHRQTSAILAKHLGKIQTFQFHDTSDTSRIRGDAYSDDVSYLRRDAGNLAAFLKMLKDSNAWRPYYERIVRHIRTVMPQFQDFVLELSPDGHRSVRLNWTDKTRPDYLFGPDQISDGSLRFMALVTLLLQPPPFLPSVIVIDEPELGLHPAAIVELAGLIKPLSTS